MIIIQIQSLEWQLHDTYNEDDGRKTCLDPKKKKKKTFIFFASELKTNREVSLTFKLNRDHENKSIVFKQAKPCKNKNVPF